MLFESIIITGTSCAGKSTIAEQLCKISENGGIRFEQVKAITNQKEHKVDLNYEYVDDGTFDKLVKRRELLGSSTHCDEKYGIKKVEYNSVLKRGNVPVLVVTPSAVDILNVEGKHMCVFLDAHDEILIERLKGRFKKEPNEEMKKEFCKQNKRDRAFQNKAHYNLDNTDVSATVVLITLLWKYQNQGGALSQNLIKSMIGCGMLLKGADTKMIKGASYDLRLGDEYYYDGEIRKLSDDKPFLTIEPYDYAIVSCKETAWMPRDVIAKFGLTVGLFCQGIILSNGPQIDPGFRGTLFCLLFNTSNRAVHLKRGKHYATIEFNKMIGYAQPYEGQYQEKDSIIEYIPANALHGAINELKKEVEHLKAESRIMQNIYLGVVALMFAIVSVILVIR